MITYDGLEPTTENQATVPEVFVAEIIGLADAFLVPVATDEPAEGEGAVVAKGDDQPTIRSVGVPGGTVGCATFIVTGLPELTLGERYAFFVEGRALQVAGGSAPMAYAVWPVSPAGEVDAP